MRSYRKYTEIQQELARYILDRRSAGETRLEGERALAERFGAGRPSVAKALRELEKMELVRITKGGILIPPFRQKLKYAYLASYHATNHTFWFLAYKQLWDELNRIASARGFKIELILNDPDDGLAATEALAEQCRDFDLVFVSLMGHFKENKLLELFSRNGVRAVILDENIEYESFPLCALDNRAVGSLAAQILVERGYRKTALLAPIINTASLDFLNRISGFSSAMRKLGGYSHLYSTNASGGIDDLKMLQQRILRLPGQGFDSVFYLDDNWVMLSDPLIETGYIPEFGILAVDGTMTSRMHNPPIDTISHATIPLAEKLCSIIEQCELGKYKFDPAERIRIFPRYLPGKTLRAKSVSE